MLICWQYASMNINYMHSLSWHMFSLSKAILHVTLQHRSAERWCFRDGRGYKRERKWGVWCQCILSYDEQRTSIYALHLLNIKMWSNHIHIHQFFLFLFYCLLLTHLPLNCSNKRRCMPYWCDGKRESGGVKGEGECMQFLWSIHAVDVHAYFFLTLKQN